MNARTLRSSVAPLAPLYMLVLFAPLLNGAPSSQLVPCRGHATRVMVEAFFVGKFERAGNLKPTESSSTCCTTVQYKFKDYVSFVRPAGNRGAGVRPT